MLLAVLSLSATAWLAAAPAPPAETMEVRALALLLQIEAGLEESVAAGELSQIHNEDALLFAALTTLKREASPNRRAALETRAAALGRSVADLHAAADAFDRTLATRQLAEVSRRFGEVVSLYDAPTVALARARADRFTCPMHPDVQGRRGEPCPKCGMPEDVRSRVWLRRGGDEARPATVRAQICTESPLRVGEEARGTLRLVNLLGEAITPDDLRLVHTKKIHLLIVDATLDDYHHEHPLPTDVPGEYAFHFTPRKPGDYRAFADVQPLLTGFQEYARATIAADTDAEPTVLKTYPRAGENGGLRYELAFDGYRLRAGTPADAHVRVSRDGQPFRGLEPVMAAFAHLVGFHENGRTVLHMHPLQATAVGDGDRGGPDLAFRIFTDTPGYYRLFLQTQVDGTAQFVPFGVDVTP